MRKTLFKQMKGAVLPALMTVTAAGVLLMTDAPAQAGNIWMTGHDADYHCSGGSQCNHFGIAVDFARIGAPDPTKPILVLDRLDLDVVAALGQATAMARNTVEGAGNPFPYVVMDPRSVAFAAEPLLVSVYSAIVVASDFSCGGCDLNEEDGTTPDSDAINLRAADIASFFNAGGGLAYMSGAESRDVYYDSIPVGATASAVSPPFTLTGDGLAIGLLDPDDTNCCPTHNSFELPGVSSPLVVAETDENGKAETLFLRRGTIVDDGGGGCTGFCPSVPEPSTLIYLASGFLGLGLWGRRKFSKD
jgi:hypothetical protein